MNRDAWLIFAGLVVVTAVGLLGTVAWQKNRELESVESKLTEVRSAADADAARMAEAWHEVEMARSRAEALARDMAAVTNSQKRLEAEMRSALQSRDIAISELQGELTLTILDRILFDSGDATLKPEGTHILDQIAGVLAPYTNRQVQVIGHTDNVPIRIKFPSNWELSAARAIAAVRYLTEKAGVDPRRLSAVGCGEFQPIGDNATPDGRAQNRRIALVVLPERFVPTDVLTSEVGNEEAPPTVPDPEAIRETPVRAPVPPVRLPALPAPPSSNGVSDIETSSAPTNDAAGSPVVPAATEELNTSPPDSQSSDRDKNPDSPAPADPSPQP